MADKVIKISVRNLVEFILREGDIDNRFSGREADAMKEGSRIHRKLQKQRGSSYKAEVPLKLEIPVSETKGFLLVEGRADGIMTEEDGVTIDEIKSMYLDVEKLEEPVGLHLAQAKCYAYIYALQNDQESITVQMTYVSIETEHVRYFREVYTLEELKSFFNKLIDDYKQWVIWESDHIEQRNASVQTLSFPFPYREGQRDLVAGVLSTLRQDKMLFIEAPTGVGKTISTVFPAVWQMGQGKASKLFYLTAKTIARTVAFETFDILYRKGLQIKLVTLTSKEKLCVLDKPDCNPIACTRAKGHYDRINEAVFDLICNEDMISRELVNSYAKKHMVCPFEMMLDASLWADAIICDYNYVFDPTVKLKRFFADEKKHDYVFLIDEAHNLVERGREMYSAELFKESFLEVKRALPDTAAYRKLSKGLERVNKAMLAMKRECDEFEIWDGVSSLALDLMRVVAEYEDLKREDQVRIGDVMLDLYFDLMQFLNMYDLLDENYMIYSNYDERRRFRVRLQCMDPSHNLKTCLDSGRSAIFFSATLLPVKYYMEQLGANEDDYAVYAPSPFPKENRLILIGSEVSTKYSRRTEAEYRKLLDYIVNFTSAKTGNYLVFFPSYKMMKDVADLDTEGRIEGLIMQEAAMSEQAKEEFLASFAENPEKTRVGFCVLGGIFGEGIDLANDRLIGAVIVGTGLPMVCDERELFRGYYDNRNHEGFNYAYLYPGMNKVLQAAGRVIRTMEDRGAVLLLDERFLDRSYQALFPREWYPYEVVSREKTGEVLKEFWR